MFSSKCSFWKQFGSVLHAQAQNTASQIHEPLFLGQSWMSFGGIIQIVGLLGFPQLFGSPQELLHLPGLGASTGTDLHGSAIATSRPTDS